MSFPAMAAIENLNLVVVLVFYVIKKPIFSAMIKKRVKNFLVTEIDGVTTPFVFDNVFYPLPCFVTHCKTGIF